MSASDKSSGARVRPLRRRLLFLAASGLLPLMMVLAWGLDYLIDDRRVDAERSAMDLSRALATAVDAELRSVVALLNHMSTSDDLERADLRSFQLAARRTARQMGWLYVALSDSEGRALLRTSQPYGAADPALVEPQSVARVIETHVPVVSGVIDTSKLPTEAFAVRIPVMRGEKLVYVLSAYLPSDQFLAVLSRQNIPSGSVASVFDQFNHRLARSRQPAPHYPSPSLRALIERGDAQGAGITVTVEGVESYAGYTRLASWGWVVAVGTSVAAANNALYALLRAVAAGLAASLAFAMFLAWVLSRQILEPINALKEGAAALGRGEPVQLPPLDIVELDDVAVALTDAAADRDRAAAQIATSLRAAEEANRSKDQFLAVLGHELRNPLAPISTAVQLMAIKGDESTVQERRIIERQLVHVTRLVDDLLDISRITGRRLTIRHEPVRLAHVLTQVVETMRPSLSQRSLSLELAPGFENAWVAGDEVRLAQVFNNLLVNAIKFTNPGDSIRVKAAVAGLEVQVDIEDTGVGLSPTELERIFELFYQAPQSSDRARGGLGLGLPIVRSLVEMQGGRVQAASGGLGQGTRLTVRLPLCEAPVADEAAAPAPAVAGAGNLLVVDDNHDAADTCAALLEISGYTVRVAYTPEAALEVLREFKPDVAILDIGLPGMSGYALAGLMKAPPFNYRGRLLALTGYGQATDVAASSAAGFHAHLTKPVAASELLQLVEKFSRSHTQPSERSTGSSTNILS
jgi:signal transduction histidine kinase/ActR/RegA family two-component response regulator